MVKNKVYKNVTDTWFRVPLNVKCHAKAQWKYNTQSLVTPHTTEKPVVITESVQKYVSVIFPTTCRSRLPGEQPTVLISGLVSNISLGLDISNQRDDAFQAVLSFSLPSTLLEFVRVEPRSVSNHANNPHACTHAHFIKKQSSICNS